MENVGGKFMNFNQFSIARNKVRHQKKEKKKQSNTLTHTDSIQPIEPHH